MEQNYVISQYQSPNELPPVVINDPSLPLISIVTPSYNQGGFIRETIESVLNQEYPNIEYWVIDGGSSDSTISVLKEYEADPRFHWLSEKDRGQSDAINKGLLRCRGELFTWLNSDDCLLPHALSRVAAVWISAKQPVLIYGLARFIDHVGNDLGYCPIQSRTITLNSLLWSESLPIQPATFVPTSSVRAVGGVDLSLHYAMDLDLWIRLAEHLPIKHISADLALYRLHGAAKTVALSVKFIDDLGEVLHRAAQRGLLTEQQARSRTRLFAARTYLMPDVHNFAMALASLQAAIRDDYTLVPKAAFILFKGLLRLLMGEKFWSQLRLVRAKLS